MKVDNGYGYILSWYILEGKLDMSFKDVWKIDLMKIPV